MTFSINKPTLAINKIDLLSKKQEQQNEQLSSGFKINSAKDDAAGLQISNRLSAEIAGLNRLSVNAQDQVNLNNVTDAQLSSITNTLLRVNELSIQSGNPLYSNSAIQIEFEQLTEEINLVAGHALGDSKFISGLDSSNPVATQNLITEALEAVASNSTDIGAQSNTLNSQISTYEVASINSRSSRSRILDTDYATAVSEQKNNNLLLQASLIIQKEDEDRKGLLVNKLV
ncbi:flagellin [Pseudoalteromonas sp. NBT06-2]|uniref:flagellin n=1 Tax=Pseudoalteromonas sp. NBT06-2 TaxID=2025950 RepID=UPI000BA6B696|nr:flagellin [Pseudoalteromonas sp. NBT06-2]PAJ72924.1 flagellin [Pseudoalteromonas sp. NBT06-2]